MSIFTLKVRQLAVRFAFSFLPDNCKTAAGSSFIAAGNDWVYQVRMNTFLSFLRAMILGRHLVLTGAYFTHLNLYFFLFMITISQESLEINFESTNRHTEGMVISVWTIRYRSELTEAQNSSAPLDGEYRTRR
jgi:hypothetical protein